MRVGAVAKALGVDRRTIHRMISDGTLRPVTKRPGSLGAYEFDPADVEALAATRAAALEAKLAALRAGGAA